eukprot:CAMPEP_0202339082 /NCGR_PEP_ID=MMETSP1126-20121109/1102_1 /ASSEMBLY_ACC=CAM_ASM_000457 /TAXON_ID=3047 /ORGANISM="Dunaliella tertiolecta, Strain CCMP1320" /LENGTH=141 /DNA_ID=CAMNT_0048929593 /DNA_START=471 /DNA_END=896 /DNA_ORIENTATION=+
MDFSSSLGVPCLGACVARADRTLGANEETGAEGAAAAASAAQGPNVVRPAQLASVHAPQGDHACSTGSLGADTLAVGGGLCQALRRSQERRYRKRWGTERNGRDAGEWEGRKGLEGVPLAGVPFGGRQWPDDGWRPQGRLP